MRPVIHAPIPARKLRKPAPIGQPEQRRESTSDTNAETQPSDVDSVKIASPISSDERKAAELFG